MYEFELYDFLYFIDKFNEFELFWEVLNQVITIVFLKIGHYVLYVTVDQLLVLIGIVYIFVRTM